MQRSKKKLVGEDENYLALISSGSVHSDRVESLGQDYVTPLEGADPGSKLLNESSLRPASSKSGKLYNAKKYGIGISCRIDAGLHASLQQDANANGISLNSLINSILKNHSGWNKYASVVGLIPVPKDVMNMILDCLAGEELVRIADSMGKTLPRELITLLYKTQTFDNVISLIEVMLSQYGMVQRTARSGSTQFVLYHGSNRRFSEFLAKFLAAMAEDMSIKLRSVNPDARVLAFQVSE